MKTCTGCRESKPLTEFNRDKQRSDGLTPRCKICRRADDRKYARSETAKAKARERSRRWDAKNPEKRAALNRAWREKHPDYSAESNRKWREANPDAAARYYQDNRERLAEVRREWRERNREFNAERVRAWAQQNPERRAASVRKWQAAHPEKAREISHRRRARLREATVGPVDFEALWVESRGLCGICAEPLDAELKYPHPSSVSLDHIVPLAKGGTHEQSNLQWAHLVCNTRKGAKVARRPIQMKE